VDECLKLVKKIVSGMYQVPSNILRDDMIQVGALGMLKAIESYVPIEKGSFKTYASKFIKGRILQYLRDKTSLVKTPRISTENVNKVKAFLETADNDENIYFSAEDIAHKVNLPIQVVEDILNAEIIKNVVSLDQKVYSAEGVETLADRIQSDYDAEYEESFENKKMLEYALNKLDKTERTVIYKYYIEGLTKKSIAEHIGVSAMQVGRIIKRVLNKMYKILEEEFNDKEEK
jgi:RNA polymerase sigma-B factor